MVERHNEIIRQHWHKVHCQLLDENLRASFKLELAECVFAKNALLSVDGTTPYHALLGRVPRMLADFEKPLGAAGDDQAGVDGASKHVLRLREVSLQKRDHGGSAHEARARVQDATSVRAPGAADW